MRSAADAYNTETDPQKAEKYKREMDRIGKNMADDITYMVNFLARAQATAMVRMVASLGGSNVVGEKISKLYEGRRLDAAFEKKVSKPFEAQDKELKQQEEVDAIRRGG
jgi:DNA-directed RNA polymerase beta' subunit